MWKADLSPRPIEGGLPMASNDLPAEFVIEPRIVVTLASMMAIVDHLEHPEPTADLIALVAGHGVPDFSLELGGSGA